MRRLHPPIHLLRAFVATARHGSVSRAAQELHLTQSAVSKQVLELEDLLGVRLFQRVRGRLVPAPAGERYRPAVAQALELLQNATLELMAQGGPGYTLNLSTLPTFGAKWLIPRLPRFQQAHPQIILNFVPFTQGYDFAMAELDCAIRWGQGVWPGAVSHYLAGRDIVVIAPAKLPTGQPLRRPQDAARHTLLQHAANPTAWARWCEEEGVDHPSPLGGPRIEQVTSMVRAVMAGLGIALVPRCLVQEELENGLVSAPLQKSWIADEAYHLCYPEAKADLPAVIAFRDWVVNESAARPVTPADRAPRESARSTRKR